VTEFDDLLDKLASVNTQTLRYEVEKLRAIKTWALDHLGIDYKPGDTVVITSPKPSQVGGGWDRYREALAPGQTGTAGEITFNPHGKRWQCTVVMTRTWTVNEQRDGLGHLRETTRRWKGPADETPDGFEPPSPYDRQRYPDGEPVHFFMDVTWLAKATTADAVRETNRQEQQ